MSASNEPANYTRIPAVLTEVVVSNAPCILYAIIPEPNTTAGTITVRDAATAGTGATPLHVSAIGLSQSGKSFGPQGIFLQNGLTITISVVGDRPLIVWDKP